MRRVAVPTAVAEEVDFLDSCRVDLRRRHAGQFLVIRGRKVLAVLSTEREAYIEGVRRCGTEPFLLAQLGPGEDRAWVRVLVQVDPEATARDAEEVPAGDAGDPRTKRLRRHFPRWGPMADNPLEVIDSDRVD